MRRLLLQCSLIFAVFMVSTSAASGGPPGTFEYSENGRGIAHNDATIEVQLGKNIVMQTFVLQPGFTGLWPTNPGNTLVVVTRGAVSTYLNCTDEEAWETGHAYYLPAGKPGHANTLVKNEGKEPAELVVAFFDVPADQPPGSVPWGDQSAGECAPRGTFSPTEQGRVLPYSNGQVEMEAGKKIVVQSFAVEPGFNFFWHKHPGPGIVLQNSGTITVYMSCKEKLVWEPGYAYLHTPGHHSHEQETAKNEGKETAQFVVFFFNVWEWHPAPLVPRDVQPPPSECPTASL
jgi:quercetin dioxygenase-like cupin family protein